MALKNRLFVCLSGCAALCTSSDASQFIPLGYLDSEIQSSAATAVDATGHTVIGNTYILKDSNWQSVPFIWQPNAGMQRFGISNDAAAASAITPDGKTVVGRARNPQSPPDGVSFITNTTQGFTLIGSPNQPYPGSAANGVSDDGKVVAGSIPADAKYLEAYRWSQQDGLETLGNLPGATGTTMANAISPDGRVIVGQAGWPNQTEAFRWTRADGMTGLGDLPGGEYFSWAYDVSENGSVIVGASDSAGASSSAHKTEAFRWDLTSGMVGLGFLSMGSPTSIAVSVTPDGSAIVGTSGEYSTMSAFVWDATHGMRSLQKLLNADSHLIGDLTGWILTYPTAISANGQAIVGWGTNPQGHDEAFLVLLDAPLGVPEPRSLAICLTFCAMSIGTLRQRRAIRC